MDPLSSAAACLQDSVKGIGDVKEHEFHSTVTYINYISLQARVLHSITANKTRNNIFLFHSVFYCSWICNSWRLLPWSACNHKPHKAKSFLREAPKCGQKLCIRTYDYIIMICLFNCFSNLNKMCNVFFHCGNPDEASYGFFHMEEFPLSQKTMLWHVWHQCFQWRSYISWGIFHFKSLLRVSAVCV